MLNVNELFFRVLYPFALMLMLEGCITKTPVDLIVHNAKIYTVDENFTIVEAMAVQEGKIVAMGKENQILNKYSAEEMYDAQSQVVFPGFIDAHCHFLGYGLLLSQVQLADCKSFDEVVERCKKHTPQNGWIVGMGWNNEKWKDKQFPVREKLDEVFPDTPVLLRRIDGHAALANSKALELAEIDRETLVSGGQILKDENGLTGVLVDKAVDLVLNKIPSPSVDEKKRALLAAQRNCLSVGLTTVDDAGLDREDVELIEKLHKTGELKIRIYAMLKDTKENFDYYLNTVGEPYRTERLTVNAFKFYGDGAMGSSGACLLQAYADQEGYFGTLLNDTAYFKKYAQLLYDKGFQMCTHAIGDATVRTFLNIYGEVLKGTNDRRWRIEHAQLVAPEDFPLFAKYTIVPSVQPTHATSDFSWIELKLGKKRMPYGYAYKKLLQQNGWIALGTDFPIEDINPITTFYASVARKNKDGLPKNGFQIENALTREETIRGMTIWAALANFEEQEKGSLELGKNADFVVLNQDLMQINEDELLNTKVIATFVGGEKLY